MVCNSYVDSQFRDSKRPLLELLAVIKNEDVDAMSLEKDIEQMVGKLTFWIDLKEEVF